MNRNLLHAGASCALVLALAACGGAGTDLVASGKALLAQKDTRGAVIQFKNALQKNPNSAEARFLLGKTLLDSGDPVAALVELRKAQELQTPDDQVIPELARAMLLVGEEARVIAQYAEISLKDPLAAAELKTSLATAFAMQRDGDKARATAEQALRLKPGHAPALIVLARLRAMDNDIDGAIVLLDEVLAADVGNERAGILKGELILQGKRDIEGSVAAFRKVLESHPNSVAARAAVANLLFQQKKVDEAKVEFALMKKSAPNHPETLFLEAQLAFADKDYKRTREIGELILKVMPDNVRMLELAGGAEYRLKNYLQAEALLSRALKLAPRQGLTRLLLAQTYLRSGQPAKSVEVLQPVLDTGKADALSLSLAGEAYLQLGDTKRSEDAFQRALKTAPQDARVRTSVAMSEMAKGNNALAATELEAIAGGDNSPRADLALVSARLRQGDIAGALKAIDGLEKKLPDQALPLHLRGRVLTAKKDLPGAVASYQAALAKEPGYFPSVAALAALDLAAGRRDEARQRFEAHLKTQPKSWQAKLALAELDARTGATAATVATTLRQAVKLNPAEPRPHLVLINQLIGMGDGKAALQAAQDAAAALPNNLEILEAQGRAELAAGDHQRAISTFRKLASLQPRVAMHEMRMAEAFLAAQDTDSAVRSLRRATELQPDLVAPWRTLAALAVRDKRLQDALTIARDLQKRHAKDPAGFALEGEIETSRQGWEAAITAYRAALQRAPQSSDLGARLHAVLSAAGKSAEAARFAADWQKANPKDATFIYYLGDSALARKDLPAAETHYRAVLALQPENALALNNLAWLTVKQGKPGGVALAEKAIQLLPDRAPLLDTLATALDAEQQLPKAIETQKRAIALDPKDGNMTLRLAKLYIKAGEKDRARAELQLLSKLGEKFAGQAEVASLLKTL
jgi:putative PEP-CTERM system TPR-repeat lipoprotein